MAHWRAAGSVLVACALLLPVAHAQAREAIVYGSPDRSIWTTRVSEDCTPDNPLLRVAERLFAKAGIPWRAEVYPASRLFQYLKEGRTQFSMLVRVPSLAQCCLFSRKAVTSAEIRVYRRPGAAPINRREDLIGKQVITLRGYSYGGLAGYIAEQGGRIVNHDAPSHEAAFRMLASGRADYAIDYAGPAREVLAQMNLSGYASDLLSRQDIFLVLSRQYPDAEKVMAELEAIAAEPAIAQAFPR